MKQPLKIVVLAKQVPDTRNVGKDAMTPEGTVNRAALPAIFNPEDLNALEAALRIKDRVEGSTVHILTMGPQRAADIIRDAMFRGADGGYLLSGREFAGSDTLATSYALSCALRKIAPDLIVAGRQAIDGDTAQVGPQIAEHLGLAHISYAEDIRLEGDSVVVKRQYEDRYHVIRAKMPCLVTALSEMNTPRYMTPGGIFDAWRSKKVTVLTRPDLDIGDGDIGLAGSPTRVFKSFAKSPKAAGTVEKLDPRAGAQAIVARLAEKHII